MKMRKIIACVVAISSLLASMPAFAELDASKSGSTVTINTIPTSTELGNREISLEQTIELLTENEDEIEFSDPDTGDVVDFFTDEYRVYRITNYFSNLGGVAAAAKANFCGIYSLKVTIPFDGLTTNLAPLGESGYGLVVTIDDDHSKLEPAIGIDSVTNELNITAVAGGTQGDKTYPKLKNYIENAEFNLVAYIAVKADAPEFTANTSIAQVNYRAQNTAQGMQSGTSGYDVANLDALVFEAPATEPDPEPEVKPVTMATPVAGNNMYGMKTALTEITFKNVADPVVKLEKDGVDSGKTYELPAGVKGGETAIIGIIRYAADVTGTFVLKVLDGTTEVASTTYEAKKAE